MGGLLRGSSKLLVASAVSGAVLGTGAGLPLLPVVAWPWRIVLRGLGSGLTAWTGAWRGPGHCECCPERVRGKDGELISAKLTAADGRRELATRARERSGLCFSRGCFVAADEKSLAASCFLLKHISCDGALREGKPH